MSWNVPATAVAGSILAAAFWNQQVRDNFALVKTSISDDGLTWTGAWAPAGGTVTVSTPVLNVAQTWNAGAVAFTLLKANVTDTASAAASLLLDLQVGGASKFKITKTGAIQVDGLDIDQQASDGDILRFRSSDVAHGITDFAPTDVYGTSGKASANSGGLMTTGYSEATEALTYRAFATTVDTSAASTGSTGLINYRAYKKSGTSVGSPDASAWLFSIGSQASARFLFREDGNFYSDGSHNPSAYDAYDDAMACRALDLTLAPEHVVESEWDAFVRYRRADLIAMGILSEGGFICHTKHAKLLNGAIWQQHVQHRELREDVECLRQKIARLSAENTALMTQVHRVERRMNA